jgi:Na+/melibiose symporter-like transporter
MELRTRNLKATKEPEEIKQQSQLDEARIQQFVFYKLITFSILVFVVPLLVFYFTVNQGLDSTHAGILAAVSANVVLIAYIVVAFLEK